MERYVLNTHKNVIEEIFGVETQSEAMLEPNFNAAPGHALPVISKNRIEPAIWDSQHPHVAISAVKSDFFGKEVTPCIIPVSGFYLWKQTVNDPLPFYVRIHSRALMGIAGMLITSAKSRNTYRVLTRDAGVLLKPLSETMPCILEPFEYNAWLAGEVAEILQNGFSHNMLMPDMTVFRVTDLVNDLSNNSPELIQPIPKLREED